MTPWGKIVSSTINRMKRQHTEWEGIFAILISEKNLISKTHKNYYNSIAKRKKIKDK